MSLFGQHKVANSKYWAIKNSVPLMHIQCSAMFSQCRSSKAAHCEGGGKCFLYGVLGKCYDLWYHWGALRLVHGLINSRCHWGCLADRVTVTTHRCLVLPNHKAKLHRTCQSFQVDSSACQINFCIPLLTPLVRTFSYFLTCSTAKRGCPERYMSYFLKQKTSSHQFLATITRMLDWWLIDCGV